ncbi:type II restriction enzyme [Pueribacillus sp. YX66]|uniref:type II restriction enzyme n=1 Tax=Pueribacillus sp. YX66 TaxID=3229242 RepID=UPI00358D9DC3
MSVTNKAWDVLFERHNILQFIEQHGYFIIQAKEIKKEREPRLMAKFDHSKHLPKLFKENGLSILPISRSSYIIGEFDAYEKVEYDNSIKPEQISFPPEITTIDPTNLYSESSALHCAFVTGMIEDVLGEKAFQTISGRMSSQQFDFNIRMRSGFDHQITIKNSQVEIDGGYESISQFMLIEAKNQKVEDFLVRQLFYPYRLWKRKTNKRVKPIFFTYSNDIFSFFIYEFLNDERYNSLQLVEQKDYIIAHEHLTFENIIDLFKQTNVQPEPKFPFPQADSFPRVVDLLSLLMGQDLSKHDITLNYDFDDRQTNYYTTAGMYLGLIEKYTNDDRQTMFTLTRAGKRLMGQRTKEKFLKLAQLIFEHKPFNQVFAEYLKTNRLPCKQRVVEIMKNCQLYNLHADSTYYRRAQTVLSWIKWIVELPKTY